MNKPRAIVLGASGMLGWTVSRYLYENRKDFSQLIFTVRKNKIEQFRKYFPEVGVVAFDATSQEEFLDGMDYAVNCIGMINKLITPETEELANELNIRFVDRLISEASQTGTNILHISTDCVFSGLSGGYDEMSKHDAHDVYGLTKSKSEFNHQLLHIIRCSIIGHELDTKYGLLEWFLSKQDFDIVDAYHNHLWNGITTLAYAKLMHTIMVHRFDMPQLLHFVPLGVVTKAGLISLFAKIYQRDKVKIRYMNAPETINRTLNTVHGEMNERLWNLMGYPNTPTIPYLVKEMSEWQKKYSQS